MLKLNRFAVFAWGVLAYILLVILWGAVVRATGAGAGCGSHWPLCNGEVIPHAPQTATLIELSHRLTSGLALPLIVALAIWAWRIYPRGHRVRKGAGLSVVFLLTEALIGAGLVRFELVADNASVARALFMSIHLANTFVLIATLTATAWWASGGSSLGFKGQESKLAFAFAVALAAVMVLGMSGAVAALGDTLFPVRSLAEGLRQDFSPTAHLLIRLRLLHPTIAIVAAGYIITLSAIVSLLRPDGLTKSFARLVIALNVVQLLVGALNVALLAPIWLQLVHLLLADLIWIALILLASSALAQRATNGAPAGALSLNRALKV
ncbi:MAG: COX15/CtaA family protein [Pyrinomonadaceae bacterium]